MHKPTPNIGRKEALLRATLVQKLSYDLKLILRQGRRYSGYQTICFDLNSNNTAILDGTGLKVDCIVDNINKVRVNGSVLVVENVADDRGINLPVNLLKPVGNYVEIVYDNSYGKAGTGLHRYKDPIDDCQYIYTQFESAYCHTAMPCFDQPDLRGSFSLSVICSETWVVTSNERLLEKTAGIVGKLSLEMDSFGIVLDRDEPLTKQLSPESEELNMQTQKLQLSGSVDLISEAVDATIEELAPQTLWRFVTTPPIAPYLYALCAGDYMVVHDSDLNRRQCDFVPPMALYFRKSVVGLVTRDFCEMFFCANAHSINWFSDFMSLSYAYSKLDSVLCPEYNWGAMENVGCITYNESHLWRISPPSRLKLVNSLNTIIHEVAHHWFGNLVTMRWWNDLWLNEAFATYMASRAQEYLVTPDWTSSPVDGSISYGSDCWIKLGHRVFRAMKEDCRPTNHPIAFSESSCKDTQKAETAFDGISYGKGSQFLKMLVKIIGEPVFQQGIRLYMAKYQGSNASLEHFVSCIGLAIKDATERQKVEKWAMEFLSEQRGVPELTVVRDNCGDLSKLYLVQSFSPNCKPVYQTFIIDVTLFFATGMSSTKQIRVEAKERTEIVTRHNANSVLAVLPNSGMHAYCYTTLDLVSIGYLTTSFQSLSDGMDQLVFLKSLSNMVKQGKYSPLAYLKFHYDNFMALGTRDASNDEEDVDRIKPSIRHLLSNDMLFRYSHDDVVNFINCFLPQLLRVKYAKVFRDRYLEIIRVDDVMDVTSMRFLIDCIIRLCEDDEGIKLLQTMKTSFKTILSQGQRHAILKLICASATVSDSFKDELCDELLNVSEDAHDLRCRTRCTIVRPNLEQKIINWELLLRPTENKLSQTDYCDIAQSFLSRCSPRSFTEHFVEPFFENLARIFQENNHFYARSFLNHCIPTNVIRNDWQITDRLEQLVLANKCGANGVFLEKYATALIERDRQRQGVLSQSFDIASDWPDSLQL